MFDETMVQSLHELCLRHHVKRLELFGSASRGEDDPSRSDMDFLVEFLPMSAEEHADAYFGLLEDLQDKFERTIDLVEIGAIRNPGFLRHIDRDRKRLYAA